MEILIALLPAAGLCESIYGIEIFLPARDAFIAEIEPWALLAKRDAFF